MSTFLFEKELANPLRSYHNEAFSIVLDYEQACIYVVYY